MTLQKADLVIVLAKWQSNYSPVTCMSAAVAFEVAVKFQVNLISSAVNMKLVDRLTNQLTN